ncbi:MAG: hypothetical protein LBE56_12410 [Tannerella sp.]|jgi:hypothetical protein|nr:hypothetical protein [Tannerella sp.]
MKDLEKKLIRKRDELLDEMIKLEEFIASDDYLWLRIYEQKLLDRQHKVMDDYYSVLDERISLIEADLKPEKVYCRDGNGRFACADEENKAKAEAKAKKAKEDSGCCRDKIEDEGRGREEKKETSSFDRLEKIWNDILESNVKDANRWVTLKCSPEKESKPVEEKKTEKDNDLDKMEKFFQSMYDSLSTRNLNSVELDFDCQGNPIFKLILNHGAQVKGENGKP